MNWIPPSQPSRDPTEVVSILSSAYTDLTGTDFNPNWGQTTNVTLDNSVLTYTDLNYQGTNISGNIDVRNMDYLHIDLFSEEGLVPGEGEGNPNANPDRLANVVYFSLIQEGGANKSKYLTITPGQTTSFNIPIPELSVDENIKEFMFGQGQKLRGNLSIANIYFYNGQPEPPVAAPVAAPVAICFPAGTPVTTDQGNIPIEKLKSHIHTIRGKSIVAITQTRLLNKHIVSIEKDALVNNVPSQTTHISNNHKVFFEGKMVKAKELVDVCEHVNFIPYNGETLYNVLLKKDGKMMINNLICETLSPTNVIAMILKTSDKTEMKKKIRKLTSIINKNDKAGYKKFYASLK